MSTHQTLLSSRRPSLTLVQLPQYRVGRAQIAIASSKGQSSRASRTHAQACWAVDERWMSADRLKTHNTLTHLLLDPSPTCRGSLNLQVIYSMHDHAHVLQCLSNDHDCQHHDGGAHLHSTTYKPDADSGLWIPQDV